MGGDPAQRPVDHPRVEANVGFIAWLNPVRTTCLGIAGYVSLYVLSPVEFTVPLFGPGLLYIGLCYLGFLLGAIALGGTNPRREGMVAVPTVHPTAAYIVLALALIGVALRIYDVYIIRGFQIGGDLIEEREGLASGSGGPAAILGTGLYLFSFALIFLRYSAPTVANSLLLTCISHVLFWFPSVDFLVKGSRSIVLVNIALFLLAMYFYRPHAFLIRRKWLLLGGGIAVLIGSVAVFVWRLNAMGVTLIWSILRSGYAETVQPSVWALETIGPAETIEQGLVMGWVLTAQYFLHGIPEFAQQYAHIWADNLWGAFTFHDIARLLTILTGGDTGLLSASWIGAQPRPGVYNTFFAPIYFDFGWTGPAAMVVFGAVVSGVHALALKRPYVWAPLYAYLALVTMAFPILNIVIFAQGLFTIIALLSYAAVTGMFDPSRDGNNALDRQ